MTDEHVVFGQVIDGECRIEVWCDSCGSQICAHMVSDADDVDTLDSHMTTHSYVYGHENYTVDIEQEAEIQSIDVEMKVGDKQ